MPEGQPVPIFSIGDFTYWGSEGSRFRGGALARHDEAMQEVEKVSRVDATLADMRSAAERLRLARWHRDRVDRAIWALDSLVGDLEQLNLEDRSRVPLAWQPRLARLAASMPVECGPGLKAGISPLRLLDHVYDIQQQLLWLKQGAAADELRRVDGELEALPLV